MKRLVSMGCVVTGMAIALAGSMATPVIAATDTLLPADLAQQFNPPGDGYPDRTRGGGTQMGVTDRLTVALNFHPPGEGFPRRTQGGGTY